MKVVSVTVEKQHTVGATRYLQFALFLFHLFTSPSPQTPIRASLKAFFIYISNTASSHFHLLFYLHNLSLLLIFLFSSYIPLPFCASPYLRKTEVAVGIMANFQAHRDMLLQQQQLFTTLCDQQLQSFNMLYQSFPDLNARALAVQHGPSAPVSAASFVQQAGVNTSTSGPAPAPTVQVQIREPLDPDTTTETYHIGAPSTLPIPMPLLNETGTDAISAVDFDNLPPEPATAAMSPELDTPVVGSNVKAQSEFRPFPKLVPRITLSRRPRCQELLFFDKQVPVANELVTGQEQSDKEDHASSPELYHDHSSCASINLGDTVPESRYTIPSSVHNDEENHELKALLEFCPVSLTYGNKTCPLREDCTLKKICHNTTRKHGCTNKDCKFSHEHTVTCGSLRKNGRCRFFEGKGCRYNHDQELRNTISPSIHDHVELRIFGAKKQVVEETITQDDSGQVEEAITRDDSGQVEEIVTQDDS